MSKRVSSLFVYWLAMLAILMNVFVPSISHAIASTHSKNAIDFEICSATGSKISHHLEYENTDQSPSVEKKHCPLCTLQTYFLPPIDTVKIQFSVLGQYSLDFIDYQSPPIPFIWNISSPRAPPFQA